MDPTDTLIIETLDESSPRRLEALGLMLAGERRSGAQGDRRIRRLLDHVKDQALRIGTVVGASAAGRLVSAAMVVESPGALGSVFIPTGDLAGVRRRATVAVLQAVPKYARRHSLTLLQALLGPEERPQCAVYTEAGFELLAELTYLDRSAKEPRPARGKRAGLEFVSFRPELEPLFLDVLARTYQQSRDCPRLTGVRLTEEVLAAHRATGLHDPNHWFVARLADQPVGVLLLAGVPDHSAFEVVYIGVVPEARGSGMGDALLDRAVDICRRHRDADLTLAVDSNNEPALCLYRRWRFREVGRRQAWIWINPDRL